MTNPHRSGKRRLLASLGVFCVLGLGLTVAAFTDHATVRLGTGAQGSGIGDPDKFDIAVRDATSVLQDAPTAAQAVVLPLTSGTKLSEVTPVVLNVRFENRNPGVAGDLLLRVMDPNDEGASDLFRTLRFTVYLDGSATPTVTNASASDLNAANIAAADRSPGEGVDVRYEVLVAPGTGIAALGKSTQIGAYAEGQSR